MTGPLIRSTLISVSDVDRSSDFYGEVLGAPELMRDDGVITLGWAERGGSLVFLRQAPRSPSHQGGQAIGLRALTWDVGSTAELDRVEARLRAHDAFRSRRPLPDNSGEFVHGHDPDRLALVFLAYDSEPDLSPEHFRSLTELMFALDM